MLLKQAIKAI